MLSYFLSVLEDENDRKKFTMIYELYHGQMEKVAMRILQNQRDAEDAMQNAFLRIIDHFSKVDQIHDDELLFWVISIVKNEALMIYRKNMKIVPLEQDWDVFANPTEEIQNYSELVALFSKLPETYRTVLEMRFIIGYAEKEIAKILNITETAVSTRVSRGRQLLRKIVEKEGFQT